MKPCWATLHLLALLSLHPMTLSSGLRRVPMKDDNVRGDWFYDPLSTGFISFLPRDGFIKEKLDLNHDSSMKGFTFTNLWKLMMQIRDGYSFVSWISYVSFCLRFAIGSGITFLSFAMFSHHLFLYVFSSF